MSGEALPASTCIAASDARMAAAPPRRAPKAPVLGWDSFRPMRAGPLRGIFELPHQQRTTSGRAALLAALRQMALPAGHGVLVPTYQCPTMIAPVLQSALQPVYYPIDARGLPRLDALDALCQGRPVGALFVAHYFGLPNDLRAVVDWCHARGILVVEDCAHAYFGLAGDRPVGHWGDYAAASLSKFFPVPEGGLIASARPLSSLGLARPGLRDEMKGLVDVAENAWAHGRLAGVNHLLAPLWRARRRGRGAEPPVVTPLPGTANADDLMEGCDMGRVDQRPTQAAVWLHRLLPHSPIVARRREHYRIYSELLATVPGAHGLRPALPDGAAPYVWPLWIDGEARAQRAYAAMREQRLPVFRWDRTWPGTPQDPQDVATGWGRQLIQLLCHQDLGAEGTRHTAQAVQSILANY